MVSGLSIDFDKTKLVKIGAWGAKRLNWEGQFGLEWTDTFEALGITYKVTDIDNITEYNFNKKITSMKSIIRTWKARSLTLYGKVAVLKSLVMSKVTHLFLALPCPNKMLIKSIENLAADFSFEWKNTEISKRDYWSWNQGRRSELNILQKFSETLKLAWLKRTLSSKGLLKDFPKVLGIDQCIHRGNLYVKALVNKIDSPFWYCVANSVLAIQNEFKPKRMTDLMGLPIWNNSSFNNLNYQSWVDKGVYLIGDVVSENTGSKFEWIDRIYMVYKQIFWNMGRSKLP